jgi:hypothetical protein
MIAPTIMPVRLAPVWGGGVTGGADTVIAGRDIVVDPGPVEPTGVVELGGIGAAGRDMVDDADGAAWVAARIPVVDAGEGAVAERMPVDESEPVAGLGGTAAVDGATGAPGAAAAPEGDTKVVPHCTQNFAPV